MAINAGWCKIILKKRCKIALKITHFLPPLPRFIFQKVYYHTGVSQKNRPLLPADGQPESTDETQFCREQKRTRSLWLKASLTSCSDLPRLQPHW